MGEAAEAGLRKALAAGPSAEVTRRLERLLLNLRSTEPAGERLRTLRALQVVELMGTPEARQFLEALAKGEADAWLTGEARAALQRLDRRSARQP
jgi:hypothetical protein